MQEQKCGSSVETAEFDSIRASAKVSLVADGAWTVPLTEAIVTVASTWLTIRELSRRNRHEAISPRNHSSLLLTVTAAAPTQSLIETHARAIIASWYTPSVLAITDSRA